MKTKLMGYWMNRWYLLKNLIVNYLDRLKSQFHYLLFYYYLLLCYYFLFLYYYYFWYYQYYNFHIYFILYHINYKAYMILTTIPVFYYKSINHVVLNSCLLWYYWHTYCFFLLYLSFILIKCCFWINYHWIAICEMAQ